MVTRLHDRSTHVIRHEPPAAAGKLIGVGEHGK
jgi:hypothetical protein